MFVQPDNSQACLLRNVLLHLGLKVQCAHVMMAGGKITQSQVRLVQKVIVPSQKAKFVKVKLDVPLIDGEESVIEPVVEALSKCGLTALLTLKSDSSILVPVENYEALAAIMDADFVLGNVVRPEKIRQQNRSTCMVKVKCGLVSHCLNR